MRPTAYAVPKIPDAAVVIGGWAFFDGEPAILPEGLHLLVITDDGPDGRPRQLGRDPAAILALLAPYARRLTSPCPHFAVRVPPRELAGIRARVAELPEHDPLAAPGSGALPGAEGGRLAAPRPRGLHAVSRARARRRADRDLRRGHAQRVRVLDAGGRARRRSARAARGGDRQPPAAADGLPDGVPSIAVSAGRDLSAERLLDRGFLGALHEKLGPEMWVGVPHRAALYALRASAGPADVGMFAQLVEHDAGRAPELGHAPVSRLAFRVVGGVVVDAAPLAALAARGAAATGPAAPAGGEPRGGHPSPGRRGARRRAGEADQRGHRRRGERRQAVRADDLRRDRRGGERAAERRADRALRDADGRHPRVANAAPVLRGRRHDRVPDGGGAVRPLRGGAGAGPGRAGGEPRAGDRVARARRARARHGGGLRRAGLGRRGVGARRARRRRSSSRSRTARRWIRSRRSPRACSRTCDRFKTPQYAGGAASRRCSKRACPGRNLA